MPERMIETWQIKKIHTLISALKWKDDWYKDNLDGYFNVKSSKDLTYKQAYSYIEILKRQAMSAGVWKSSYDYRKEKEREGMATDKQINMIKAMYWEIYPMYVEIRTIKGESFECDINKALRKLLKRTMKIESLSWLKKEKVKGFMQTLKEMKKQNINTLEVLKSRKEAMVVNG
jgi:hypothetical protein